MLAGISMLYFCFSLVHFSTAALVDPIIKDIGLSLSEMGTVMGSWPFVYIFFSIPAGLLLDRFGVRIMQSLGIITITLSAFLRAYASSYTDLLLAFILFGIGAPFISVGMPKLVREWFPYHERGIALGICTAITAAGSMMALALTNSVIMPYYSGDWRSVINLYAMICVISTLIWLVIIIYPGRDTDSEISESPTLSNTWRECTGLLRTPAVQLLLVIGIGVLFFMHSTINWLPKILMKTQSGFSEVEAGYWATLPVVIGIISAVIVPKFAVGKMEIIILVMLFITGAGAGLLLANDVTAIYLTVALALVGIVRGGMRPVVTMVLMHAPRVNHNNMGAAVGLYFSIGQLGGVAGPAVFGYLAETTGGFAAPLYLLTAICLLLALLSLSLFRFQHAAQAAHAGQKPDPELREYGTDLET